MLGAQALNPAAIEQRSGQRQRLWRAGWGLPPRRSGLKEAARGEGKESGVGKEEGGGEEEEEEEFT